MQDRGDQFRIGVGAVHLQTSEGEASKIPNECRILGVDGEIPIPKIPASYTQKERILMQSFEIGGER